MLVLEISLPLYILATHHIIRIVEGVTPLKRPDVFYDYFIMANVFARFIFGQKATLINFPAFMLRIFI